MLAADIEDLEGQLEQLTTSAEPGLRQVPGVGPSVAATLLVTTGDNPERMTFEAAFAALCGACPVPASSGKTTAVRLNRGGHRQANSAPYRIAVERMSHHQPTIDDLARRTAQGKSKKSILRCRKRFIPREIHHHLVDPHSAVRIETCAPDVTRNTNQSGQSPKPSTPPSWPSPDSDTEPTTTPNSLPATAPGSRNRNTST
jgi:hypothetical protein